MIAYSFQGTEIPYTDIKTRPVSKEKITQSSNLIPSKKTLRIDNIDKSLYDPDTDGSLFYDVNFFNDILTEYDDEYDVVLWYGILTGIKKNEKNKELIIETYNILKNVSQTNCIYSSAADITGAELVYNILISAGISDDFIDRKSFNKAIAIQDANSAYINLVLTESDSKKTIEVCKSITRMFCSELYCVNNRLYYYQWQPWAGQIGYRIRDKDVITKSAEYWNGHEDIYNSSVVKYDNAGTIADVSDEDATSISIYGRISFLIPKGSKDSTTSSEYKMLYRNATGAAWVRDLVLSRYNYMKRYARFKTGIEQNYIGLGDLVAMHFYNWVGEPIRIIERTPNWNKKEIEFVGIFLNQPYEYYARDETPPAAVILADARPLSNDAMQILWTESDEADHLGYKIYFTTTPGEWESESCNRYGRSPVDIKNPVTVLGICRLSLYGLSPGTKYYVKVVSYDTSYNESDDSNIDDCQLFLTAPNKYYCYGNVYDGLILSNLNVASGTVPADATQKYGTATYGTATYTYAAQYESSLMQGITSLSFIGLGKVYYQYRDSLTGSWSAVTSATGSNTVIVSTEYFQIRFLWRSTSWSDTDSITVTEII